MHYDRLRQRFLMKRGTKGFSCWEQFVAMLFCQMAAAHSLREIRGGLASVIQAGAFGVCARRRLARLWLTPIRIVPGSSIK
jgi:hypothetical protein